MKNYDVFEHLPKTAIPAKIWFSLLGGQRSTPGVERVAQFDTILLIFWTWLDHLVVILGRWFWIWSLFFYILKIYALLGPNDQRSPLEVEPVTQFDSILKMAENGVLDLVRSSCCSNFWVLIANLRSVFWYFEIFGRVCACVCVCVCCVCVVCVCVHVVDLVLSILSILFTLFI